jgi:hypothetical protein
MFCTWENLQSGDTIATELIRDDDPRDRGQALQQPEEEFFRQGERDAEGLWGPVVRPGGTSEPQNRPQSLPRGRCRFASPRNMTMPTNVRSGIESWSGVRVQLFRWARNERRPYALGGRKL